MDHLAGRTWLRSHEEEEGPIRVYRPQGGHAFPPARGREGLVFHEDGRFEYRQAGRGDRPDTVPGTWRIAPGGGDQVLADAGGEEIELRITEATADVLRLEWLRP
ncbi:hypothetical protein [Blastococcus sp. CCUG 61487]|uniref:hypothetical protein n=1 Tax=Blastococcus sp. CCUG 61487 TaxID=1840703 RepID=UPI0010BFCFD3|nr:hypothetical protein [Blastococcus sp. CCUG 61487]TKJ17973.1 hypothetical protein A6V29_01135 [Blastococcus sp. CCUG 61487]